MHTRRLALAWLAALSASAGLFLAQPAAAAQTQADPYTQGGDRQADTYGYLAWKYDRFDPYGQGADRQTSAHEALAWRGDTRYPGSTEGAHA